MNLYSRLHTSVLPSSPYLNNTLCLWDVRTNLLEKYVHEWDKEEEREDNESERDLLPPFSLERGLGNREKTENRRSLLRRPSLILGLEEIWRGVLKSRPGFPFLSPRGLCSWYTTTLYLYPFPASSSFYFVCYFTRPVRTRFPPFPLLEFVFIPPLPSLFSFVPPLRFHFLHPLDEEMVVIFRARVEN